MSITLHIKCGQNKWDVSIEPTNTVIELKEAISKVSEIPPANQRLIYSGKILKDDQTVESYKIADDHAVHLVRSGGSKPAASKSESTPATGAGAAATGAAAAVPSNISSGQTGGFNPLADLTGARYAGYANLPSADMFGPDGGLTNAPNSDEILNMLDNPIVQSQMNEMLSNPQMVDFMIQQNPQLQAMGPRARELLQSDYFRQMMTNPDMIRQSMQFARMFGMEGAEGAGGAFPAPGTATQTASTESGPAGTTASPSTTGNGSANSEAANPFASLFNGQANPFASMFPNGQAPQFDPSLLSSFLGGNTASPGQQQQPQDNRPPEERYEQQLRQLNDMGFFDFDRNVAALRRSGGSVQGALDALLNGDV